VACELTVSVALADKTDVVPEHAAQIADLLVEERSCAIRVVAGLEEQWMPALHAYVFRVAVSLN
jgi:hypothetical protein